MPPKNGKASAGHKAVPLLIKQESSFSLLPKNSLLPNLLPLLHNQLNLQSHQSRIILDAPLQCQCLVNQLSFGEYEPSASLSLAYAITMGSSVKQAWVIADANLALYKKPDLEV
jgi:hypothetical protein